MHWLQPVFIFALMDVARWTYGPAAQHMWGGLVLVVTVSELCSIHGSIHGSTHSATHSATHATPTIGHGL